jgi:hypothetical protein
MAIFELSINPSEGTFEGRTYVAPILSSHSNSRGIPTLYVEDVSTRWTYWLRPLLINPTNRYLPPTEVHFDPGGCHFLWKNRTGERTQIAIQIGQGPPQSTLEVSEKDVESHFHSIDPNNFEVMVSTVPQSELTNLPTIKDHVESALPFVALTARHPVHAARSRCKVSCGDGPAQDDCITCTVGSLIVRTCC